MKCFTDQKISHALWHDTVLIAPQQYIHTHKHSTHTDTAHTQTQHTHTHMLTHIHCTYLTLLWMHHYFIIYVLVSLQSLMSIITCILRFTQYSVDISQYSYLSGDKMKELPYMVMLNSALPEDIRVLSWAPVGRDFSARFNCLHRTYKYFFPRGSMNIGVS